MRVLASRPPPLVAMACSTIPCGFSGYDRLDKFVTEDNGIWAEALDADQIFESKRRTAALEPKSARVKSLRAAGQETGARYPAVAMTKRLVAFWSDLAPQTHLASTLARYSHPASSAGFQREEGTQ